MYAVDPMSSSMSDANPALPAAIKSRLETRLFSGEIELPFLPATAAEVMATCRNDDSDARKIADLMQRDQSLAAHVLRVSNSAAYAPKEPIVSLQQAVSRLGTSTVCEIAIAVSLKGRVFDVPGWRVKVRELWIHSAATAVFAKEVARIRRFNVEGSFLCGLLHDVGKPLVMQALLRTAKEETDRSVPPRLMDMAMAEFHERVGALLIEAWSLPEWMKHVVANHHNYSSMEEYREETMITHLTDELCHWALEEGTTQEDFPVELPVIADMGLYADEITQLLDMRGQVLDVAESFL